MAELLHFYLDHLSVKVKDIIGVYMYSMYILCIYDVREIADRLFELLVLGIFLVNASFMLHYLSHKHSRDILIYLVKDSLF